MYRICFCLVFVIGVIAADSFPSILKNCHLSDPEFKECLRSTIEFAMNTIGSNGIPSLKLPSIEPMEADKIQVAAGSAAVSVVQNYYDVKVYGLSKSKVLSADLDLDKKTLTFVALSDEVTQKSNYDVNGKIIVFPVRGHGDCEIVLKQFKLQNFMKFKEEVIDGKKYFKILSNKIKIDADGAHFQFNNLFDGDKLLGDNINRVINENWKQVFYEVVPEIEKSYATVLRKVADKLFDAVPIDEIFLP